MTDAPPVTTPKPYAMLGAGELISAIWKTGDERSGRNYRFNIYRCKPDSGHVRQVFRPADVADLVKLCQVLAATLADDGCIPEELRRKLLDLAIKLDGIDRTED